MKCLVTGGAGFVGTNLIKRLLKDGYEVVSVDNYSIGKKENEQDGCKYYEIDLSDKVSIDSLESIRTVSQIPKFDVIFHLAAKARIVPSIENPLKSLNNNINSTINILEYARKNNTSVVYAGSSSAHGDIYANPYTFTKWNGEELCKLYSNVYDLPIAICRFYNVYGDGQLSEGAYCTVLGIFERQWRAGEKCTVVSPGSQTRDFTHINDVVNGLIKIAKRDDDYEWHLRSGINVDIVTVAEMFGEWELIPMRRGERFTSEEFPSDTEERLGWKPTHKLEEWIKYVKKDGR